jgi:Sigma-70, region 4
MARYTNQQIFDSIHNGDENILFYLSDTYFQTGRRQLRRSGCRDSDTPVIFSRVLTQIFREIQHNKISPNIDLENFIFNSLKDYLNTTHSTNISEVDEISSTTKKDVISCFSIMDENSRNIVALRYVENLSFEEIAVRLNFSNPHIAEYELNKAFNQFENITKARLLISEES